jgi:CPA1 family monovalent cation:H+ antiporter
MDQAVAIIELFAVAAVVALAARRLRVPYTVALVVAGLGLSAVHAFAAPHLTKELLYALFLPGLIFEAAFALDIRRFLQIKWLVLGLAVPGLVVVIAITSFLLIPLAKLAGPEPIAIGALVVFSALISATDPIAVVALFKQLGAPKRLATLVEAESLLNDGTAAVATTLVVGAVVGGTYSVSAGVVQFATVVGMGALAGAAIGGACSFLMRWVNDPMIETTLTTLAAYGSFLLAVPLHVSGMLPTMVAGCICGAYGAGG